jgi:hypothetical protein
LYLSVARNTIPKFSKSVSQADNQLHSIIHIKENNSFHALLLKIMTDSPAKITPKIYQYGHSS